MSKQNTLKQRSAFSLIELSVVITVIALIATALLSLSTVNTSNNKIDLTNKRIESIYKAMGIYLAKNGKLPCPAPIKTVSKVYSTYGVAATSCTSTPGSASGYWQSKWFDYVFYGMVPVQTLGLPVDMAEDAFGTRFGYAIISGFTVASTFGTNDQTTYSTTTGTNRIMINKKVGTDTPTQVTNDAMFVIISYGPNMLGGWAATNTSSANGTSLGSAVTEETVNFVDPTTLDTPTGRADFYNYDTGGGKYPFVIEASNNSFRTGAAFDDKVFYKTRTEMVHDFKLYALLPCITSTTDSTSSITGSSFTWNYSSGTVHYGEAAPASSGTCSTPYNTGVSKPTKRCGAFGTWETYLVTDCS